MKFSHSYYYMLLQTIFMVTLLEHKILMVAARRKQSDSILEIMNTREIEQILVERERRLNISNGNGSNGGNRDDKFIIQNDLDEDFTDQSSKSDRYHNQNRRQHQQHENDQASGEIGIGFDYPGGINHDTSNDSSNDNNNNNNNNNKNRKRNRENHQGISDVLMPYNDTLFPDSSQTSYTSEPTIAAAGIDLQDIRGDKILKSSKNALYITRKEYLKKDWCKTEPLVQRIREPGCLTRTFINRFCYGQCNSFYIPKSPKRKRNNSLAISRYIEQNHFEDEDLTPAAFRSCGFCKPKKFTWITVTLRCPSLVPQLRKKRVQRIKQCRCMAEPLD